LVAIPGISQQKATKFVEAAKDYVVEQEEAAAEEKESSTVEEGDEAES
jgi:hypothetical protein